MLKMELKFWGIDEALFNPKPIDKFQQIQEIFDRPIVDFFEREDDKNNFFFKTL